MWVEERSGLPENQKLSNDDVVKRYLENAMVEAAAGKETVDKAPWFPLRVIAALELMVSIPEKPTSSFEGGGLGTSGESLWGAEDGRRAANQARRCGVDGVGFAREEMDQDNGLGGSGCEGKVLFDATSLGSDRDSQKKARRPKDGKL